MKTALAICVLCVALIPAMAMDRFAALSMVESGDNDNAIGADGEITRYQIKPRTWNEYQVKYHTRFQKQDARLLAWLIVNDRVGKFVAARRRQPSDVEWYLLWNCPADVAHPSRRESLRAQRFANLCSRKP